MPDVGTFFDQLNQRGSEHLPAKINGTIRFDLTRGDQVDHWLVAVKKGNVFVSRDARDADAVVRADAGLFESMVIGETNMLASVLRNEVQIEGSLPLLLAFRRAIPSVPGAVDPRRNVADREAQR